MSAIHSRISSSELSWPATRLRYLCAQHSMNVVSSLEVWKKSLVDTAPAAPLEYAKMTYRLQFSLPRVRRAVIT